MEIILRFPLNSNLSLSFGSQPGISVGPTHIGVSSDAYFASNISGGTSFAQPPLIPQQQQQPQQQHVITAVKTESGADRGRETNTPVYDIKFDPSSDEQVINQSINQLVNRNQSDNQLINQSTNQPISQ